MELTAEFSNIDDAYKVLCTKADAFIEGYKEYYKEELKKNGKDIQEICKMRTNCNFA